MVNLLPATNLILWEIAKALAILQNRKTPQNPEKIREKEAINRKMLCFCLCLVYVLPILLLFSLDFGAFYSVDGQGFCKFGRLNYYPTGADASGVQR